MPCIDMNAHAYGQVAKIVMVILKRVAFHDCGTKSESLYFGKDMVPVQLVLDF